MMRAHIAISTSIIGFLVCFFGIGEPAQAFDGTKSIGRLRTNQSASRISADHPGRFASAQRMLMQRRAERVSEQRDAVAVKPGTTEHYHYGDSDVIVTEGTLSGAEVRALERARHHRGRFDDFGIDITDRVFVTPHRRKGHGFHDGKFQRKSHTRRTPVFSPNPPLRFPTGVVQQPRSTSEINHGFSHSIHRAPRHSPHFRAGGHISGGSHRSHFSHRSHRSSGFSFRARSGGIIFR